ncbi:MAG: hypothetical protein PHX93_02905 [Candidatus Peribacteraceae bacterium]|jgi:hypothetical protein|nr:hypothetical protein [Candidatus Peribacteraceae bacterium]
MINEPLISKHYTDMPLSELESRSLQLDAKRQHIGKGQMPHGMSVYRRRLMKALETKRAEQAAQQERYMHSQTRSVNTRLTAQQRYEKGNQQGESDARKGISSRGFGIEDDEERKGYIDGYRSMYASQRAQTFDGWDVSRY